MKFTDLFIRRPVLASVVSLLILLIGLRSLSLLNVRQYPETTNAVIRVSTTYTGASADLVQGFITTPMENSIATADGIDYLESSSQQGLSQITARIRLGYDPNVALTQITGKVNQVRRQLPAEAQDPVIDLSVGETTASMYISFYSDALQPNQVTDYLTRVVQPKLSAVSGVQEARIFGARVFAMRIWLKPQEMAARGITASDVRSALESNNFLAAVGSTKGPNIAVPLDARTDLQSVEGFSQMVVKRGETGVVRLQDVALVDLGAENYDTSTTFNGDNATFMAITVLPTANPLTVIQEIRRIFPDITQQFPPGLNARITYDATVYIEDSIGEVQRTLIEALLIVVAVIYLFLGSLRSVIIPVVAIPLSLIGAGFLMLVLGFSINLLTLLAMVLAIGLVVDDAIIVVENIQRHIEEGKAPLDAALIGARELAGPVIAMTVTLLAVYAPIAFMGGLTGSLFTEFAMTLAGAVLISGVVALTLSPMMCAKLLKAHGDKRGFVAFLDRSFGRLKDRYQRALHGTLNYVPVTAVFSVVVLASCYFLFVSSQQELAPTEDQGIIIVQATAAPNASLAQTELYTKELNKVFASFPETANVFLINGFGGSAARSNAAFAGMVFKPWSERERTPQQLLPIVQEQVNGIAGLQTVVFTPPPLPGGGRGLPVQFVIGSTEEPLAINNAAQQLLTRARASGLFAFADIDVKFDNPQTEILINRDKAAALGIDMQQLGADLATMLGGNFVNWFSIEGRSYRVIPQVRQRYRINPEQIDDYQVRTASGSMVPLSTIVTLRSTVQPDTLNRFQQLNAVVLSAVPLPGVSTGQALDYLEQQAREVLPRGYSIDYAGQSRQYVQEGSALVLTFFLAIAIIFLVLAAQFESFRDPLVIMFTVPLAISGALIFLSLGFASVNIYTQVGLITLIGLISRHGILMVEFANQLQQQGASKRRAIEEAAAVRLRPILMTTAATVLGVVPLLLASGAGAVSRFDIGLVIASGMSIGTLFTLFVVPAMYMLLARERGSRQESSARGATPNLPVPAPKLLPAKRAASGS